MKFGQRMSHGGAALGGVVMNRDFSELMATFFAFLASEPPFFLSLAMARVFYFLNKSDAIAPLEDKERKESLSSGPR